MQIAQKITRQHYIVNPSWLIYLAKRGDFFKMTKALDQLLAEMEPYLKKSKPDRKKKTESKTSLCALLFNGGCLVYSDLQASSGYTLSSTRQEKLIQIAQNSNCIELLGIDRDGRGYWLFASEICPGLYVEYHSPVEKRSWNGIATSRTLRSRCSSRHSDRKNSAVSRDFEQNSNKKVRRSVKT